MVAQNHDCLNAKLMAANAKRLNSKDYQHLIKAKTIDEIWTYLRDNTVYHNVVQTIDGQSSRRIAIERGLRCFVPNEIKRFSYYVRGQERVFLRIYGLKEDLINLKFLIRMLTQGVEPQNQLTQWYQNAHNSILPVQKWSEIQDWDSFKRVISQTELERVFSSYHDLDDEESVFSIEKAIERFYYDRLMGEIKKLPKREHLQLIEIFKKEYDLLNLIWFYRGKRFYHLTREELIAYSFKGGAKVKIPDIEKLSDARTLDEFLDEVQNYPDYNFLFPKDEAIDLHMEKRYERYLHRHFERLFYRSQNGFDKLIAYIEMLYIDVKDITSMIECKRYQLTEEETRKYLIRSINGNRKGIENGN
ncbi:MAG: V-type ATPase subunit [Eubacteriaceae bacterium]|jgi:V/A-type H+-transporting ATPase subunit C|nr:V-type ATPase subunit [Eubacteriaceae bacterium]